MENKLKLMIDLFEKKVNEAQNNYKEKHKDDFDKQKMDKYVNRKLEKEINGLIFFNVAYPFRILNSTERFK